MADKGEPAEAGMSFDELESELDALDSKGVPDNWQAAFSKIRSELKSKRERYTPYEQAFSKLPEQDADALLQVARVLPENPEAVAKWMLDTARDIGGESFPEWVGEQTGAPTEPLEDPEEEATVPEEDKSIEDRVAEAVAAALAKRDEESEQQRAVDEQRKVIESKLAELGYTDPAAPDARLLLLQAQAIGGDPLDAIAQAHDGLEQHYVEKARQYAEQKTSDAVDGSPAPQVGEGSEAPISEGEPEETDPVKLMNERLARNFGAEPEGALH